MTTTYLHQENVRAILTEEPRVRNDAIDRLLGLSPYKDLLGAIKAGRCGKSQTSIIAGYELFAARVDTALKTRRNDLDDARRIAEDAGLSETQFHDTGLIELCSGARKSLVGFIDAIGIASTTPPAPTRWEDAGDWTTELGTEITRLRSELPGIAEQTGLFERKENLSKLQVPFESARRDLELATVAVAELDKKTDGEVALRKSIADLDAELTISRRELKACGKRVELVNAGIGYLQTADATALGSSCPLCSHTAPDLLLHLKQEWESSLEEAAKIIKAAIDELEEKKEVLEKVSGRFASLKKDREAALKRLVDTRQHIGEFLGKQLTDKDDPLSLLAAETARVDQRLAEVGEQVTRRQEELNDVSRQLDLVATALSVVEAEQKMKSIESIQESDEFKQLDTLRDEIATFVDDIARVQDAVTRAMNHEAQAKISTASSMTAESFRRITDHPSLGEVQLRVESKTSTGQNNYSFVNSAGQDITPLLSQGDYNALALSLFLGLGTSLADEAGFGFFILDDPSQSLHATHKERLVDVLDEIARHRNLLISTMDTEFDDMLRSRLTCATTRYRFHDWSPTGGPTIERS
jgi:DNA repair exonuclease SbcCD ATPase subunit